MKAIHMLAVAGLGVALAAAAFAAKNRGKASGLVSWLRTDKDGPGRIGNGADLPGVVVISVLGAQQALAALGEDVPTNGLFDEATRDAWSRAAKERDRGTLASRETLRMMRVDFDAFESIRFDARQALAN